ncbi:hypothetical protein ID866_3037 [Astraeus odoratus]|nr:hypothetical protein ID866_3037 [Astraeus odoratus]
MVAVLWDPDTLLTTDFVYVSFTVHESRDRILLGGEDGSDDDDFGEEEVFALEGISDEDESHDKAYDFGEEGEDEDEESLYEQQKPSKSKSKSKKARKEASPALQEEDEEEETWGRGKHAYYSSNAAQIDSDDEEAQELEEQEARRLQTKAREHMQEEDFGIGEVIEGDVAGRADTEAHGDKNADRSESETDATELGLQHMYYQSLLTYATTLAFYLHMRASEKYTARPQLLRSHPILKRLLTLKQSLSMLENIGVGEDVSSEDEDEAEEAEEDLLELDSSRGRETLWDRIMNRGLESDELADLIRDAEMSSSSPTEPKLNAAKGTSKSSTKDVMSLASSHVKPPRKKRKAEAEAPLVPVFDLVEPDFTPLSSKKIKTKKSLSVPVDSSATVTDPYGEATTLSYADASDKQARKKSLRFHVSRIESSSSRRQNARTNALGGDDDIPYRERKKDRDARLEKERVRKGEKLGMGGDDLDDVDPELETRGSLPCDVSHKSKKRRRGMEDDDDDDGGNRDDQENDALGYYDLVKTAVANKRMKKKADYEFAVASTRPEFQDDKSSGPRSITRAILKNKGLTPTRSKSVRNPRVKKRQKYEKAKKRVASQKAVYKGGIGDVSKYGGEKSGISKVVKSVALG